MDFGPMLRAARKDAGLTLRTVAHGIGVSVPYLSDIERGKRGILPARAVVALAGVGIDPRPLLRVAIDLRSGEYVRALRELEAS